MPAGRPTTYLPEYCDRVTELGAQGESLAQIAADLDCPRASLWDWAKANPEFSAALSRAKDLSLAWWEARGALGLEQGPKAFDGRLWARIVAARWPDDYRESKGVELTGAKGGPVKVEAVDLTEEQILGRLAALRAGGAD